MERGITAQSAPSSGAKTFTLAAALAALLRVAAAAVLKNLGRAADLGAIAACFEQELGGPWGSWGLVCRALHAAQERLEEVGPRSSRQARATDDEVLVALLRSEATEAVDALLVEVGERLLPGVRLLPDLATRLQARREEVITPLPWVGPYTFGEVLEAWCVVCAALHQCPGVGKVVDAGDGVAVCPNCIATCGAVLADEATIPPHARPVPRDDRPTDPVEPPVPELVVELPALVAGDDGDRLLAPIVAMMHRVLACRADVVRRGGGLALRFRVPLDVPRLLCELDAERRRAGRLELAAKGGES